MGIYICIHVGVYEFENIKQESRTVGLHYPKCTPFDVDVLHLFRNVLK